jgi:hypothetical protein
LGLSPERAISNLVYTFYRRNRIQDTIYGYYRAALVADYAASSKKTKKPAAKVASEGQGGLLEDKDGKPAVPKKRSLEAEFCKNFDAFFGNASEETIVQAEKALGIFSYKKVERYQKRKILQALADAGFSVDIPEISE